MIKKQLLSCSIIILALLGTKVVQQDGFANNINDEEQPLKVWQPDEDIALVDLKNAYLDGLEFANQKIPFDDVLVEKRLFRHLKTYSKNIKNSPNFLRNKSSDMNTIADILQKYGIPEDFKYIPIVESNLKSDALSPKGAYGYWQFMPATARSYGLKVNGQVDERKDLIKSTHAAAKYFKALYEEFGDWALVAAAYNVGDGNLKKAIKRQKEDDYFKLKLNSETSQYVYKIIAIKEVLERPNHFKYEWNDKTLYAWDAEDTQTKNTGLF